MSTTLERLDQYALALAPAFRDKFDFSDDKQFAALADLSYKAAQAMIDKSLALRQADLDARVAAEAKAKSDAAKAALASKAEKAATP